MGIAEDLHLLKRATYGPTPALVDHVAAVGHEAFVDEQLDPSAIPDPEIDALLPSFQTLDLTALELFQGVQDQTLSQGLIIGELQTAAMVRAWLSRRQLFEVMVDFWTDHLNVYVNKQNVVYLKTVEDREAIRPYALGRFLDLLARSATSPAMLVYLDQAASRADGDNVPNENYAREVLELHTVGVDGGYDEQDVVEAAYVLSGLSVDPSTGLFQWRSDYHDLGPLAAGGDILGWTPNPAWASGNQAVLNVLSLLGHLARLPQTAEFLAWKLARKLVRDDVSRSDAVVQDAAAAYLAADTGIAPMVRSILTGADFRASAGRKVKRPAEYVAHCLRVLDTDLRAGQGRSLAVAMLSHLTSMGQRLFQFPPPTGYPVDNAAWASAGGHLARWNFAQRLAHGQLPGASFDGPGLLGGTPDDVLDGIFRLGERLYVYREEESSVEQFWDVVGLFVASGAPEPDAPFEASMIPQLTALLLEHPVSLAR